MSYNGIHKFKSEIKQDRMTAFNQPIDFQYIEIDTVDDPVNPVFPFNIDGLWKLERIAIIQIGSVQRYRYILQRGENTIFMEKIEDVYYFFFAKFMCSIDNLVIPPPMLMTLDSEEEFLSAALNETSHNLGLEGLMDSSFFTQWLYTSTSRNVNIVISAFDQDITIAMGRQISQSHFKMF